MFGHGCCVFVAVVVVVVVDAIVVLRCASGALQEPMRIQGPTSVETEERRHTKKQTHGTNAGEPAKNQHRVRMLTVRHCCCCCFAPVSAGVHAFFPSWGKEGSTGGGRADRREGLATTVGEGEEPPGSEGKRRERRRRRRRKGRGKGGQQGHSDGDGDRDSATDCDGKSTGKIRRVEEEQSAAVQTAADVVSAVAVLDAGLAAGHNDAAVGRHDVRTAPAGAVDVLQRRQPAGGGSADTSEPARPGLGRVQTPGELRLLGGHGRVHVLAGDTASGQHGRAHADGDCWRTGPGAG